MTVYMKLCTICVPGCCHHFRPPITWTRQQLIDCFLQDHMVNVGAWLDTTTHPYAFPREIVDDACIFFDSELRTCLIHAVKPETCRAGPITFDLDIPRERILWFGQVIRRCAPRDDTRLRGTYHIPTQSPSCRWLRTAASTKAMPMRPSSTLAYLPPSHSNGWPSRYARTSCSKQRCSRAKASWKASG